MADDRGWRLRAYRQPSGQFAVVSGQPGYAGPPGPERVEIMRDLFSGLFVEWDLPAMPSPIGNPSESEVPTRLSRPASEDSAESDLSALRRRMTLVLEMVAVLHRRGFERLRIVPGMSGSGFHWRCALTPATNVMPHPGLDGIDAIRDHEGLVAHWTNANEDDLFGNAEAQFHDPPPNWRTTSP